MGFQECAKDIENLYLTPKKLDSHSIWRKNVRYQIEN